jgi:putative transposase
MRLVGLPAAFHRVNRRAYSDVPPEAARRASVVVWIDGRRRLGLTCQDACRLAGVSTRSYYRWRSLLLRYGVRALADKSSRPHSCRVPTKRRLVAAHVERLRKQYPLGKEKVAVLLAREGITVSASTVGRILDELLRRGAIEPIGYNRRKGRNRRRASVRFHARRKRKEERPTQPGQLVQLDTLHEYSNQHRRIHFTAIDPITRFSHAKILPTASSRNARIFLEECLAIWPHPINSLQVDNGSEFKGHHEQACQELGIELVTIPPATPKANGKVERMQRTFRDEHYAFEPAHLDLDDANRHLHDYLHFYNHQRPHKALNNRTPISYTQPQNPRATPN